MASNKLKKSSKTKITVNKKIPEHLIAQLESNHYLYLGFS
jgi:hypothetical protein